MIDPGNRCEKGTYLTIEHVIVSISPDTKLDICRITAGNLRLGHQKR